MPAVALALDASLARMVRAGGAVKTMERSRRENCCWKKSERNKNLTFRFLFFFSQARGVVAIRGVVGAHTRGALIVFILLAARPPSIAPMTTQQREKLDVPEESAVGEF